MADRRAGSNAPGARRPERDRKTRGGPAKSSDIWPSPPRPWGASWRDHGRVLKETFRYLGERVAGTVWVWLMIGIALSLPAVLYLVDTNLARAGGQWSDSRGFSVYFAPGVDGQRPEALKRRLQREAGIERVWIITPDESLAEFRNLSGMGDALDLLDENPLPATVRATLAPDAAATRLTSLADEAARAEGVDEVIVERTWFERLAAIREVVTRLSWALAGVMGLGAVLISSAGVRLAIEGRLDELKTLVLMGAGRRFVRRPFLYLGIVYGAGGAVAAAMLVAALLFAVEVPLERLFASYGGDLELTGFDPMFVLALLGCGVVLGIFGAIVSSNQRLRRLDLG